MALPYTRKEAKEWARENFHGVCNILLPSFTTDFRRLNEKAIRHDIRKCVEFGFWGTLLVAREGGVTFEETREFIDIAVDERPKGFHLVLHGSFDTLEDTIEMCNYAASQGVELCLLSYPPNFWPKNARDVVEWTAQVANNTDIALELFAVDLWGFKRIDPRDFPYEAVLEIVEFDTVVAFKQEMALPGTGAMVQSQMDIGDKVIICNPMEHQAPSQVYHYKTQWMGTSNYEYTADIVPRYFKLMHEGKWDEAMKLYWQIQPARDAKARLHASHKGANLLHRNAWKYMAWLNGFNGGLLRMPQMRLHHDQMKYIRQGLIDSGITPTSDPDEAFIIGRNPM